MVKRRTKYSPEFKAKVALAAARGDRTLSQLASDYGVSAGQIGRWKKRLLQGAPSVFERAGHGFDEEQVKAPLYQEIGRLKMELEWLKKKVGTFS